MRVDAPRHAPTDARELDCTGPIERPAASATDRSSSTRAAASAARPACRRAQECGTHRGQSLIHLERIDRGATTQTAPMVCMHCEDPTCAEVCPADAIKQNEDGIVQSALKPRCIGCSNCVLACPFGVPKYMAEIDQMMKCDMCYDRTSEGLKPMCASVCPSEALWFGTPEQFAATRRGALVDDLQFGRQEVRTKVYTVVDDPSGPARRRRRDRLPGSTIRSASTRWLRCDDRLRRGSATSRYIRRRGGGHAPRVRALPRARRRRDGRRQRRRRGVDVAAVDQHRRAPADRGARRRRGGRHLLVPIPRRRTTRPILCDVDDRAVVAFSQKCTHLGCVVYYQADEDRWTAPATRATSTR